MTIKDEGVWSVGVMWMFSGLVFVFTALRVYVRAFIVKKMGFDDHVYIFAFFCLLMYTVFVHISAEYGFGQDMRIVAQKPMEMKKAIICLAVGQTFALIGMAMAKWSLGLFLLRLVKSAWHKTLIWATLGLVAIASILSIFVFWFQCSPPRAMWDREIKEAKCEVPQLPFFYFLGVACAFADIFFAVFPWVFMWKLQMNQREKIVILCSLSLGLIAAAFGVKRCTEIPKLIGTNFLKDVVSIIIWAAAEMAVTMVCIGIPVCRPLYKGLLERLSSRDTSNYKGLSGGRGAAGGGSMPLKTIGGGVGSASNGGDRRQLDGESVALGLVSTASKAHFPGDDKSEEAILDETFRLGRNDRGSFNGHRSRGITVTEEFVVTSSSRV